MYDGVKSDFCMYPLPSVMFQLLSGIVQVQSQPHDNGTACIGETALAVMPTELMQSSPSMQYSPLGNIEDICSTNQPEAKDSASPSYSQYFAACFMYITLHKLLSYFGCKVR